MGTVRISASVWGNELERVSQPGVHGRELHKVIGGVTASSQIIRYFEGGGAGLRNAKCLERLEPGARIELATSRLQI